MPESRAALQEKLAYKEKSLKFYRAELAASEAGEAGEAPKQSGCRNKHPSKPCDSYDPCDRGIALGARPDGGGRGRSVADRVASRDLHGVQAQLPAPVRAIRRETALQSQVAVRCTPNGFVACLRRNKQPTKKLLQLIRVFEGHGGLQRHRRLLVHLLVFQQPLDQLPQRQLLLAANQLVLPLEHHKAFEIGVQMRLGTHLDKRLDVTRRGR